MADEKPQRKVFFSRTVVKRISKLMANGDEIDKKYKSFEATSVSEVYLKEYNDWIHRVNKKLTRTFFGSVGTLSAEQKGITTDTLQTRMTENSKMLMTITDNARIGFYPFVNPANKAEFILALLKESWLIAVIITIGVAAKPLGVDKIIANLLETHTQSKSIPLDEVQPKIKFDSSIIITGNAVKEILPHDAELITKEEASYAKFKFRIPDRYRQNTKQVKIQFSYEFFQRLSAESNKWSSGWSREFEADSENPYFVYKPEDGKLPESISFEIKLDK